MQWLTYLKVHNGGLAVLWRSITKIHIGIASTKDYKIKLYLYYYIITVKYNCLHAIDGFYGDLQLEIIELGQICFVVGLKLESGAARCDFW